MMKLPGTGEEPHERIKGNNAYSHQHSLVLAHRQMPQWNSVETPVDSHIHEQLIFNKGIKSIN
jgi:hypothetical protein